jgi:hypothetical protein
MAEAGGFEQHMLSWNSQGLGIAAMTLLLDDSSGGPPTLAGAQLWKNNYGLNSVYVVTDPGFSLVPGSSVGTPQTTIVNPRNMQVILLQEGWAGDFPPQLTQLAQQNAN